MAKFEHPEGTLRKYYIFSPFLRIFHWIMVWCILILFITGLFIMNPISGGPNAEPTLADWRLSVDWIRNVHFIAAFVFLGSFLLRIYGWMINRGDRLLPKFWTTKYLEEMVEVGLHYSLIKFSHKPYLRNPLARGSYLALYVMVLVEMVTGFAMYFMPNPDGAPAMLFGWSIGLYGEMIFHWVHHIFAWLIMFFAMGHVYMVFRADLMEREGEAASMFSGVKTLAEIPSDIDDLKDKKGNIAEN